MSITTNNMTRTNLATLKHLPVLVDGKVILLNSDGTYTACIVPRKILISDGFNPRDYDVLNNEKWRNLIVMSKPPSTFHMRVNDAYRLYMEQEMKAKGLKPGDKIHLHSMRGVYTVHGVVGDKITIKCATWQAQGIGFRTVSLQDYKCLAGGLANKIFK